MWEVDIDYEAFIQNRIEQRHQDNNHRVLFNIERTAGSICARWYGPGGPLAFMVWCSNDYSGMPCHPQAASAISRDPTMAAGAGGIRNISGISRACLEQETEVVDLHIKLATLVFTYGYISNCQWGAVVHSHRTRAG